jgi:carboxylate-amine ligase
MPVPRPSFTIGVEEEYLLVDPATRDLVDDPPPDLMRECEEILGSQVTAEFLRAQIEVGTRVCADIRGVREDLRRLRRTVIDVAGSHGIAVIAASTHPFANWGRQQVTDKERYQLLARDLQVVVRRLMIGGMHVHLGIEDPELRLDLLDQATYFLPHLLALSTSSPFWQGHRTGLKSYRLSVFRSMPRAGLPEHFSSWGEYRRHVAVLVDAGVIDDASHLWWDIRPSERYPTVEMRITDICTRLEDGVTVAALYLSLVGMLYRYRTENHRWRKYANMLIAENVWLAQRYGVASQLVDFGKGELVPYAHLVGELIELVRPQAEEFGCLAEVEAARDIVARGTSADHQLTRYEQARAEGADEREALQAVVDQLVVETALDSGTAPPRR